MRNSLTGLFLLAMTTLSDAQEALDLSVNNTIVPPQPTLMDQLSPSCQQAFKKHAIANKDGVPAGRKLMHQPTLKIALVEERYWIDVADYKFFKRDFPTALMTDEIQHAMKDKEVTESASFPADMPEMVKTALKPWYQGSVEFVSLDDQPDIRIVAYKKVVTDLGERAVMGATSGFASMPENDNGFFGRKEPFMFLNTAENTIQARLPKNSASVFGGDDYYVVDPTPCEQRGDCEKVNVRMTRVMSHEFGHNFGIDHPDDAIARVRKEAPQACSYKDRNIYYNAYKLSIMTREGDGSPSDYDRYVKRVINGDSDPVVKLSYSVPVPN